MERPDLTVINLSCERNGRELFTGINFSLSAGELLQVNGANGSGKTSLLQILCNFLMPVAGEIKWQQESISICRQRYLASLSYVGHQSGIKAGLTVTENLMLAGATRGTKDFSLVLTHALQYFGLQDSAKELAANLSAGQQRRVALARLLVIPAPLWILDEPFISLDQAMVSAVEQLLTEHLRQGGMVILTTHQPLQFSGDNIKQLELS